MQGVCCGEKVHLFVKDKILYDYTHIICYYYGQKKRLGKQAHPVIYNLPQYLDIVYFLAKKKVWNL